MVGHILTWNKPEFSPSSFIEINKIGAWYLGYLPTEIFEYYENKGVRFIQIILNF